MRIHRLRAGAGQAEVFLDRYGYAKVVLLRRFMPVVHAVLDPVAGALGVPVRTLTLWRVASGLGWSGAAQQDHEAVVHVELLVAVEQGQSRLVGGEVKGNGLVAAEHDDVLERPDGAAFANAAGPQSWKSFLHPARVREWSADRVEGELVFTTDQATPPRYAFLGVRPCDLRAIAIQDRVLTGGAYRDPGYEGRRSGALLIVVECTEPGATCFCVSMGTGPAAGPGYDLVMTEVVDEDGHRFWMRSGSEEGAEILAELPARPADPETQETARAGVTAAADRMGRTMPEADLRELMAGTLDAPRWDDVAGRCLTCGNCTMVCPTCFCTTTEDVTDLTGDHAERWRLWDSCFDLDFSQLHGGPVRASSRSRYRQWMTHKLGTWYDQFGSSGCVGCGRCIVWCPVGIDITEEAAALHDWTQSGTSASTPEPP